MEFHFSPNEYFSNSVLTKEYEMKCTPEENDPFSFEGPEIYRCKVSNCIFVDTVTVKIYSPQLIRIFFLKQICIFINLFYLHS